MVEWNYPLIINYDLPYSYRKILCDILQEEGYEVLEDLKLHILINQKSNKKFIINSINFEQIQYLNEYNSFYYLFTLDKNNNKEFKKILYNNFIYNVVFLPSPKDWILPEFRIKKCNKLFIQVNHNNKIIRGILTFSGYKVMNIFDFPSLWAFLEKFNSNQEIILLIDLDYPLDLEKFLYELNSLCRKLDYIKNHLHLIFVKDINKKFSFSLPNFIQQKNQYLDLPPIKKIFNPEEIIIYLIESLIFNQLIDQNKKDFIYFNFLSLKEILYGDLNLNSLLTKKKSSLFELQKYINFYKKILPIIWLYEYLLEIKLDSESIILK